jgi:hypothetical protein
MAARKVGTIPALSGIETRATSQEWGRWLYEHPALETCDGLVFESATTGNDSYAIWERAATKLAAVPGRDFELDDPAIRDDLDEASLLLSLPIL